LIRLNLAGAGEKVLPKLQLLAIYRVMLAIFENRIFLYHCRFSCMYSGFWLRHFLNFHFGISTSIQTACVWLIWPITSRIIAQRLH